MITKEALIIDDDNWQAHVGEVVVNGERKARGLVPRNYSTHPVGFYAAVPPLDQMKLIPRDEWIPRIKEQEANKSSLQHIRRANGPNGGHIPALDQNGQGYCWCYSAHGCIMLRRAVMGVPYRRPSAHAAACLIKSFKDEGGWGAESADWIVKNGWADTSMWPEKSMSRSNDTPSLRQKMAENKIPGAWRELGAAQYDANFTEEQRCTLLLDNTPYQGDHNWWSHSVCHMRLALNLRPTEAKSRKAKKLMATDLKSLDLNKDADYKAFADVIVTVILNSWTDNYGDLGECVLGGTKQRVDGAVALTYPVAA